MSGGWFHYATPCLSHWVLSYAPWWKGRRFVEVSPWVLGVRWTCPLCYTLLIPAGSCLCHLLPCIIIILPNAVEFCAICQWLLGVRRTCPLGPLCYTSLIPLGRRMPHLDGGVLYDKPVVAWCPVDWVHYATPCLSHWVLSYAPLCREALLVSPWLLGVR